MKSQLEYAMFVAAMIGAMLFGVAALVVIIAVPVVAVYLVFMAFQGPVCAIFSIC